MEDKEKEKKMIKEWLQRSARSNGEKYFENVIYSLMSAIAEVERNRDHWIEAMDDGKYPNGDPLGSDLKVNEIVWTVNYLQQLNLHHEEATRVTARLAQAFDICN